MFVASVEDAPDGEPGTGAAVRRTALLFDIGSSRSLRRKRPDSAERAIESSKSISACAPLRSEHNDRAFARE